ncbi:SDR family oxidoreductase [Iodobacter fluviatilis]|uniref:3-oxoacyl-[acyl-carrier-protein] reductase FabG n=1 Tax=Iodobacter fluviatilis TaxID=537 RepID=A0A377QB07_9NEIS|nr:SDR family oxidoreductase [Iodobacter fluviatilis]TCU81781.1 NADP-dependent 3-hydroxy acid dehydrogenase YdfG [Iodobacter fluviatilis]STQ91888.1 3-oxoacyl-[acyl-carrier-protein] reductase FabG [Iodobacter fluviatilis]
MHASALNGQMIVILGGSSGLGLATARLAIQEGARVYIGARNAEQLAQVLVDLGPNAAGATLEIGEEASVNAFFKGIDHMDHLVITAANNAPARLLEGSLEQLRISMDSRFWGAVMAIRAAVPLMPEHGSIVMTSGMVSLRPRPAMSVVAAAASAVESLARSLVSELAPRRINVINPGPMHTPLLSSVLDDAALQKLATQLPLGKLGTGEDYAQAALFALSNAYLNGSTIHLNGGAAWA